MFRDSFVKDNYWLYSCSPSLKEKAKFKPSRSFGHSNRTVNTKETQTSHLRVGGIDDCQLNFSLLIMLRMRKRHSGGLSKIRHRIEHFSFRRSNWKSRLLIPTKSVSKYFSWKLTHSQHKAYKIRVEGEALHCISKSHW